MNRLQLFLLLRRNNQLGIRRSPAFEQSVIAKVLMYLGAAFAAIYLIFFGVMFSTAANEEDMPGFIFVILPLLLLMDFGARFGIQQTPAMLLKPYMLQPMPRRAVIETFLLTSLFSGWNALWLCLYLPYCIIILAGGAGFLSVLMVLLSGMVLVMLNSQWYLLIRTLVARSLLWWLMLLVGLFSLNRKMQFTFAVEEISREQKAPAAMKRVSQFTFLERFGQTGEYLKLELKSIMRNKAIRSRVLMSLGLVVMLVAIITFSDVYDGFYMLNFWCYYCFAIYGMTALVKVMGAEGNYIDLLMTHRENILSLLRAKYYFHVVILLVPIVLTIPAVIAGKFSVMMIIAYTLLTSGVLYLVMFQLGIYNKQTLPLNQRITGKGNVENGLQLIIEMLAMFMPIALVAILLLIFEDENTAYAILAVIGLVATLAHPWWLRNIYQRMMARKYENLEGFHASRA